MLIDFAKAYDSVNRERLYEALKKASMDEDTLFKIKAIHSNSKVVINGVATTLKAGVPQGSVLSPHLFNIFIDPLIRALTEVNNAVWAYADDIAFGFRSQNEFDRKINIIKEFCKVSGMKLNVGKCELLNLGSKSAISEFPSKEVIKYLGVLINKQRKLKNHFEMLKQKVRPLVNRVSLVSNNRVSPARLIQLFFIIVKSSVDYGSVIFNTQRPTLIKPLEQFCRVTLKKILRLKASSFNAVIDQLIGIPQIEWHRRWMATSLTLQQRRVSFTWNMLQNQRVNRMRLRQQIAWSHLLVASIPKGSGLTCTLCKVKLPTSHLLDHTPVHLRRIVRKVLSWRNKPYSLMELLKLKVDAVKKVWELYRTVFNSGQL